MSQVAFDIHPDVSVILCTYDRAQHLSRAIESVLNQTFTNCELIIVDDGSSDNTFAVVDPYLARHNNIRYLKQKNKKQCYAKNVGIQTSFGNFITFLDSDDSYLPNHLESRYRFMKNNPGIDLVEGGFTSDEEIFVADFYQSGSMINLKECVLGATFFGLKKVFIELQGFTHMTYGEDVDFWGRAIKKFNTHKLKEPETYAYTRAEKSITRDFTTDSIKNSL